MVICKELTEALLTKSHAVYRTSANDLIVTSLMLALENWRGLSDLVIQMDSFGRDECVQGVDVSRTVGWFTATFPVHLSIPQFTQTQQQDSRLGAAIKAIKQQLSQIPDRGIGYGALKYMTQHRSPSHYSFTDPVNALHFNYLGVFDNSGSRMFFGEPSDADTNANTNDQQQQQQQQHHHHAIDHTQVVDVSPLNSLPKGVVLHVTVGVIQGQLTAWLSYHKQFYRRDSIMALSQSFQACLEKVISHCTSKGSQP